MTDDERAAAYRYAEMIGATVDDRAAGRCCKGGSYNGHDFMCQQPLYRGEPPLPGHPLCPCWREGGSPCWRAHGQTRDKATKTPPARKTT